MCIRDRYRPVATVRILWSYQIFIHRGKFTWPCARLIDTFYRKPSCRTVRGSTTHESQMVPCLRHSAICRRYSRFTFCLRHVYAAASVGAWQAVYVPLRSLLNACHQHAATLALSTPRSYRLAGKCLHIRSSELARMCVHLPSFHSKIKFFTNI